MCSRQGHNYPVWDVEFSPLGFYFASASQYVVLQLLPREWLSSLEFTALVNRYTYVVITVTAPLAFGAQTKRTPSEYSLATLRMWTVSNSTPTVTISPQAPRTCGAYTPYYSLVAVDPRHPLLVSDMYSDPGIPYRDSSVRLWDIESGECVRLFTGHAFGVRALAVSPDGRVLASGGAYSDRALRSFFILQYGVWWVSGADRKVILWDIGSGRKLQELPSHEAEVCSLDFSVEVRLASSQPALDIAFELKDRVLYWYFTGSIGAPARVRCDG